MLVKDLLQYCERAYGSPSETASGGRDAYLLDVQDTYQVLALRGTIVDDSEAAFKDWLNDFDAAFATSDAFPGRVHGGFLSSFRALEPLLNLQFDRPLYITGHSKGGALAFLFGYYFRQHLPLVVTFGAPRVGDRNFAGSYAVSTWRYENRHDIVPTVPTFGYKPVGALRKVGSLFSWGIVHSHQLETGYKPWIV